MTPHVTDVLQGVGLTRPLEFLNPTQRDYVLRRGQAIHLAIRYALEGTLDLESLPDPIAGAVGAWVQFWEEMQPTTLGYEHPITHPWGITGILDWFGKLGPHALAIVDYKSGDSPDLAAARIQLGGYRLLLEQETGRPVDRCYVLELSHQGRYKLHDVTDPGAAQLFTAAWMVYKARQEMGR